MNCTAEIIRVAGDARKCLLIIETARAACQARRLPAGAWKRQRGKGDGNRKKYHKLAFERVEFPGTG